jgi:hypothetical protein
MIVVINQAPRNPRMRADISRAVAELTNEPTLGNPIFLGERKRIDQNLRDGAALPDAVCTLIARAVLHTLEHVPSNNSPSFQPTTVRPGTFGSWTTDVGPAEGLSA